MAAVAELTAEQQREIVQRLADWQGPTEIAKALKAVHGVEITPQGVQHYDPQKASCGCAEELRKLFRELRAKNIADVESIRISHKAEQLRALDRQLAKAENAPGPNAMVIPLVEAAAKISGTFVHKHELTGKDGGPIRTAHDLSDDELAAIAGTGRSGTATATQGAGEPDRLRERSGNTGETGQ